MPLREGGVSGQWSTVLDFMRFYGSSSYCEKNGSKTGNSKKKDILAIIIRRSDDFSDLRD